MNINQMEKKKSKMLDQKGFSIVELIVGAAVTSIILIGVTTLINKPKQLAESVSDDLIGGQAVDIFLKRLSTALSKSALSKSTNADPGKIICEKKNSELFALAMNYAQVGTVLDDSKKPINDAPPNVSELKDKDDSLSYVMSEYSSVAARSATRENNALVVTEPNEFPIGSIVSVSQIRDSSFGGIFEVTGSSNSTITLSQPSIANYPNQNCKINFETGNSNFSRPFNDLVNDSLHTVFGQKPRTFKVERLRFVTHKVEDSTKEDKLKLKTYVYPEVGANFWPIVDKFSGLLIWESWKEDTHLSSGFGDLSFRILLKVESSSSVNTVTERLALSSYRLNASLSSNYQAVTTPDTSETRYPSCQVAMEPVSQVYYAKGDDENRFYPLYKVRVDVVDLAVTHKIKLKLASGPGYGFPLYTARCWRYPDDVSEPACPLGVASCTKWFLKQNQDKPLQGYEVGSGVPLICEIPPSSSSISNKIAVAANVTYFDNGIGSMVDVACSKSINIRKYSFLASSPKCFKNGSIVTGQLIPNPSVGSYPVPSVYPGKCVWKPPSGPKKITDCTQSEVRAHIHSGDELEFVSFYPLFSQLIFDALFRPNTPTPFSGRDVSPIGLNNGVECN